MAIKHLIVGLGNPDAKYSQHRHNVGFMVIDALARKYNIFTSQQKFRGAFATVITENKSFALLQPHTWMNESGISTEGARSFYNIDAQNVIVIHDELDFDFGTVKIKMGGGDAGHNGLRSAISIMKTQDFIRVRIGISKPMFTPVVNYVLSNFSDEEMLSLQSIIDRAVNAIELIMSSDFNTAANIVNKPTS